MNEAAPTTAQESTDDVTEANVLHAIRAVTRQVRNLAVNIVDGQVTIGGTTTSYYDKQQAQDAAMRFLKERKRLNVEINVSDAQ